MGFDIRPKENESNMKAPNTKKVSELHHEKPMGP